MTHARLTDRGDLACAGEPWLGGAMAAAVGQQADQERGGEWCDRGNRRCRARKSENGKSETWNIAISPESTVSAHGHRRPGISEGRPVREIHGRVACTVGHAGGDLMNWKYSRRPARIVWACLPPGRRRRRQAGQAME